MNYEEFTNELISFSIVALVVLLLAYLTKKKQDQYKDQSFGMEIENLAPF